MVVICFSPKQKPKLSATSLSNLLGLLKAQPSPLSQLV